MTAEHSWVGAALTVWSVQTHCWWWWWWWWWGGGGRSSHFQLEDKTTKATAAHPAEDSLSRDSIYVFVISVDERFFQRVKTRSRAPVPHDFHTLWCIFSDSRAALIQSKSSLSQTGHVLLSFKPSLFWTAAPCKLRVLKKMIGSLYTKTRPAM